MKLDVPYCTTHQYTAYRGLVCAVCGLPRRGTPSRYVFDFWRHVDKMDPSGCWIWRGRVKHDGYGQGDLVWPSRTPHRISFFLANGYWPAKPNEVDHICHNKLCVRPDHLREVTHKTNMDCRRNSGKCKKGHDLSVTGRLHPCGVRYCGTCYDARRQAEKEARRARGLKKPGRKPKGFVQVG